MFQFPGCPPTTLFCSDRGDGALPPPGFPIRISMDQSPACGSPWLNAACHVLLRQSVPWHSPCALICLIFRRPSPFPSLPPPEESLLLLASVQLRLPSRSDRESIALVDSQSLRIRCSRFSRFAFPVQFSRCARRPWKDFPSAILQNDTACERFRFAPADQSDPLRPACAFRWMSLHPFLSFNLARPKPRAFKRST